MSEVYGTWNLSLLHPILARAHHNRSCVEFLESRREIWAQVEKSQVVYCFMEENKLSKLENVRRTWAVRSGERILQLLNVNNNVTLMVANYFPDLIIVSGIVISLVKFYVNSYKRAIHLTNTSKFPRPAEVSYRSLLPPTTELSCLWTTIC
ncbi:unnamed protein product [Wuchereria bancrofti]|uniref:Uncharacterized protein n=1 Tax=Wuchereria bancrofti TaxID=6293 RepID=A0A3P7EG54_WUCBA|nr:unnamed protein product [Wuchereria bancrofti]